MKYFVNFVGVFGYICLIYLAILKISNSNNIFDMGMYVIFILGAGLLALFFYKQAITNIGDRKNKQQRLIKIFGHTFYFVYLMLAFLPQTSSHFNYIDVAGLAGHGLLAYASKSYTSHIPGLGALSIFLLLGSYKAILDKNFIQFLGRATLAFHKMGLILIELSDDIITETKVEIVKELDRHH